MKISIFAIALFLMSHISYAQECSVTTTKAPDSAVRAFAQLLLKRGQKLPGTWEEIEISGCWGASSVHYKIIYYRGQCDFEFDQMNKKVVYGFCQF